MAEDSTALEESGREDHSGELAQARAQAAEKERKDNMLRTKGRLPEQNHVPAFEFLLVLLYLAVPNDALDAIEIPADLSLIFAIPIKVILIAIDICTAGLLMMWGAMRLGTGFFGSRRIATLLGTVLLEFSPLGFVPGWSLFVIIEMLMQKTREKTVKQLARKNPEAAAHAAVRLQATQHMMEGKASAMGGKAASQLKESPSLRGASAADRTRALDVRRQASKELKPEAMEKIVKPAENEIRALIQPRSEGAPMNKQIFSQEESAIARQGLDAGSTRLKNILTHPEESLERSEELHRDRKTLTDLEHGQKEPKKK